MDEDTQQETRCVDEEMALAAAELLRAVIATVACSEPTGITAEIEPSRSMIMREPELL
jgi:hypothetical protein